jgi:hypothetical protein
MAKRGAKPNFLRPFGKVIDSMYFLNFLRQLEQIFIDSWSEDPQIYKSNLLPSVEEKTILTALTEEMSGVVDHTLLSNLNSDSYTHLTATQETDLTDGGLTSLHQHAGVASGYLVYRNTGDYIKIASVEFTTFGRCCFSIDFVGGVYDLTNSCGKLYVSISSFPFGDPPFVSVRLENHSINIRPDDITADTRPGNAIVDIWLRIESSRASRINYFTNVGQGDSYQIAPTFYSGGATVASLPVDGTLTACISGEMMGSGAPTSAPILTYGWWRNTDNDDLYRWTGTKWVMMTQTDPSTGGGIV